MCSEASLRQYPEIVKAYTGIASEQFWEMKVELKLNNHGVG
jgi:hypothetical protein